MSADLRTPRAVILVLSLWCAAGVLRAQTPTDWDGRRVHVTRESLETLLTGFEDASQSSAYSEDLRARARFEAALVRQRLQEGDFRVGDQITLTVRGEPDLSGSYSVQPGPSLVFPGFGEVPLRGVLRAELEDAVAEHLGRYIRDPEVRATSTIRITVTGRVSSPGFQVVDSGALLTDVLADAGGPTGDADLRRIRVERGRDRIWDGQALHDAIIEGRTLDELSLRAGDHIVVPDAQDSFAARWALRILTPGFTLFIIGRVLGIGGLGR